MSTNRFSLGGEHFYTGAAHPDKEVGISLSLSLTHTHLHGIWRTFIQYEGFPGISVLKTPPANGEDTGDVSSIPGSERSPGEGNGNPASVFLPGKPHGQRSLTS